MATKTKHTKTALESLMDIEENESWLYKFATNDILSWALRIALVVLLVVQIWLLYLA